MRCDEVRDVLLASPSSTDASVEKHVAACEACARSQSAQVRLDGHLRSVLLLEPPAALQAALLASIRSESRPARPWAGLFSAVGRLAPYGALLVALLLARTLAEQGIAGLLLAILDAGFQAMDAPGALIASPAVWSLPALAEQWYWLPGVFLLWLVPRIVDRAPTARA